MNKMNTIITIGFLVVGSILGSFIAIRLNQQVPSIQYKFGDIVKVDTGFYIGCMGYLMAKKDPNCNDYVLQLSCSRLPNQPVMACLSEDEFSPARAQ